MVHRDLKPSNVLLAADGPRVIDFGISRAVDATQLTQTGAVIGSPAFMSPEQFEGVAVEPASDVFSLGGVLAFAATGEGPFGHGAPHALMYRVVHGTPRLDRLPGPVRPLVERCLAKDPGQRPTAAQFLAELTAAHPSTADLNDWLPGPILSAAASPPAVTGHAPEPAAETTEQSWPALRRTLVQPPGAAGTATGQLRRRRWAVSLITAVVVLAAAVVTVAIAPGHSTASSSLRPATRAVTAAASCQASGPANGQTGIIAWKSPQGAECVGYTDSGFVFTNHAPGGEDPLQALQDERLRFDQQQVFLAEPQGRPGG